jgi:hypothetical protein
MNSSNAVTLPAILRLRLPITFSLRKTIWFDSFGRSQRFKKISHDRAACQRPQVADMERAQLGDCAQDIWAHAENDIA